VSLNHWGNKFRKMPTVKKYLTMGTALLVGCTSGNYNPKNITIDLRDGYTVDVLVYDTDVDVYSEDGADLKERRVRGNDSSPGEKDLTTEIEVKCIPDFKKVCKNNIQWQWQDSCGTLEKMIYECELGEECKEGKCICIPKCYAKFCGADSCGGSCGECLKSESCLEDTVCVASCTAAKEWENTGFNSKIQWDFGCKVTAFLGVREIGGDYLATVVGDGYFCGGQFVMKINAKGESVWIKHVYGKVIDVFEKGKGEYLVVIDQTLAIQDEKEIVYLTELCTITEKDLNTISCVGVDENTTSKRKVNTVVQNGGEVLLAGTYENGLGSSAYVVLNEKEISWAKLYNATVKDEITSIAVHPKGYYLWGKKEGKETLKLVDTAGEILWEKMYDFGLSSSGVVTMDSGLYGVFGRDISHYVLLDANGGIVKEVVLDVQNAGTKKYLLQTPVKVAQLLADGSFAASGQQDNPPFGSWVAHFGVGVGLNGLTVEMNKEIQHMAVNSSGYMAVGTHWDGIKNVEWWMKRGWCGK